jgi:hypothetical protein
LPSSSLLDVRTCITVQYSTVQGCVLSVCLTATVFYFSYCIVLFKLWSISYYRTCCQGWVQSHTINLTMPMPYRNPSPLIVPSYCPHIVYCIIPPSSPVPCHIIFLTSQYQYVIFNLLQFNLIYIISHFEYNMHLVFSSRWEKLFSTQFFVPFLFITFLLLHRVG